MKFFSTYKSNIFDNQYIIFFVKPSFSFFFRARLKLTILLCFGIIPLFVLATHNRAGEITYKQINELTYEITITTYTYSLSYADRDSLEVEWGDGTTSLAPRISKVALPDFYNWNTYKLRHVFPGPGTYEIVVQDPNRNLGVGNIPNSVNIVFAIKTILQINPINGFNNTPILLIPPIDKAALYQTFIHNPAAFDPDGDSLSFKLTTCLGADGNPIPDYFLPPFTNQFYVDAINGDLVWDAPEFVGIYNVAILIEEWRNGIKIGSITRDMQIEVIESSNQPPVIDPIDDICVIAGNSVEFTVQAWEPELLPITLTASGGPFIFDENENPATFTPTTTPYLGYTAGLFHWNTICTHVRKQPYQVIFKARDHANELSLVDFKTANIKVIAPPIQNVILTPSNNSIQLNWDSAPCVQATGYKIYRHEGISGYTPDSCITGVPPESGFVLIATISGYSDTSFLDNNNENGLNQGIQYCYIVTSIFEDGAESIASKEFCTFLKRGIPAITNVDILTTDSEAGSIYVAWAKPTELEIDSAPGPYKYLIYRSSDFWGTNLQLIDSLSEKGLNDTIFYDYSLNTRDFPFSYKIVLINDQISNRFIIGSPQIASSVFLKLFPEDNSMRIDFEFNTPWVDSIFTIYRQNNLTLEFDSISTVDTTGFIDIFLNNGVSYSYKIKSIGKYHHPTIAHPLINHSQIVTAIPIDTIPPCQPNITISSDCQNFTNSIHWNNPNSTCSDDALFYKVYYSENLIAPFKLIATIDSISTTSYLHNFLDSTLTMAGCYAVSAIDSFGNESHITQRVCTDSCSNYILPNVFTPNGDGWNDYFDASYKFVVKVDMKIFNRWGVEVFRTENPQIHWDGKFQKNNRLVTDGVYYYVCDVYENRLTGLEHRTLTGFIHIFTGKGIPINK